MANGWQTVTLGKILKRVKEDIPVEDDVTYKQVTVRLWNKGVILRGEQQGSEIKTKRQFMVRAGQLVLSRIDVRNGAIGLCPPELDGAIISNDFWTYDFDHNLIFPEFLALYVKTLGFIEDANRTSSGTTHRIRSEEGAFLRIEIPLPPLMEQRRIVARIEALAARVAEAQSLRRETEREVDALVDSTIHKIIEDNRDKWAFGVIPEFAEVNPSRKGQIFLKPDDIVSFVPMSAVDDISGTIARPQPKPFQEVSKGYTWFGDGDVIFAKITPCMENGKSAIARNLLNGVGFGSTEFHVIRPGNKILAEWIHFLTRSKEFRDDAADQFKGTAGQQRVPQRFLDNKVIPVPPLEEQRRLVAYLDGLQAQVSALRAAQAETEKELSALMPSVLDRAFKGEL